MFKSICSYLFHALKLKQKLQITKHFPTSLTPNNRSNTPQLLKKLPFCSISVRSLSEESEEQISEEFEAMGGAKDGPMDEEHNANASTSVDFNDYTIIKEGEAEILMHRNNQVFFNKTQVCFIDIFPFFGV